MSSSVAIEKERAKAIRIYSDWPELEFVLPLCRVSKARVEVLDEDIVRETRTVITTQTGSLDVPLRVQVYKVYLARHGQILCELGRNALFTPRGILRKLLYRFQPVRNESVYDGLNRIGQEMRSLVETVIEVRGTCVYVYKSPKDRTIAELFEKMYNEELSEPSFG